MSVSAGLLSFFFFRALYFSQSFCSFDLLARRCHRRFKRVRRLVSLFIHGWVNLCDVMLCGTLSSMIRWHPLLKNVQTSFMLLHVVKLLIMVADRSLHIRCLYIRWTYRRNKVKFHCPFEGKNVNSALKWRYHIQNFHFGTYIVGYTFGNHVSRLRLRPFIRRYTSPNENFEYSYPLNE